MHSDWLRAVSACVHTHLPENLPKTVIVFYKRDSKLGSSALWSCRALGNFKRSCLDNYIKHVSSFSIPSLYTEHINNLSYLHTYLGCSKKYCSGILTGALCFIFWLCCQCGLLIPTKISWSFSGILYLITNIVALIRFFI